MTHTAAIAWCDGGSGAVRAYATCVDGARVAGRVSDVRDGYRGRSVADCIRAVAPWKWKAVAKLYTVVYD